MDDLNSVYTFERLLGSWVLVNPNLDPAGIHWKIRDQVEEVRDSQVIGTIAQASDEMDYWRVFVTFPGRNGHWFTLDQLDILVY